MTLNRFQLKTSLFLAALFISGLSSAQFGLGAGATLVKGFGYATAYPGFHITGELPKDDQLTFYGRLSASLYGKDKDVFTEYLVDPITFQVAPVKYQNAMNHLILEGGNRYYLGNGYDSGFGLYGGGNMQFIFNGAKRIYDYDTISEAQFPATSAASKKGSIFALAFGLNGGVKHSFPGIGTLYLDMTFSYALLAQPTANTSAPEVYSRLFAPINFNFSLGFRKEFY
jgi:hypothetical protein